MHTRMAANMAVARRQAIFRFLAGCQSHELSTFLQLLFEPINQPTVVDLIEMCQQIEINFDVRRITSLRILNRYVKLVKQVIEWWDSRAESYRTQPNASVSMR
jgi:glutaredoxin-related protein